ncbi:hypothetical protein [Streptomyces collinus]|uniref:hypothetical protein n=1 Tax=Streptomyces collinus TaxID=42684 RepID=UPI0036830D19
MQVQKYKEGLNERLDALLNGETVWRINGDRGLRPIVADTKEEAIEKYKALPKKTY